MKKICVSLVGCLCLILFLTVSSTSTQAEEVKKEKTEVGIELEVPIPKKEEPKPPLIDGGDNKPDQRLLPKTGELLSSLIVVLLGISLFIFSLGVLAIKRLYQTASWEV